MVYDHDTMRVATATTGDFVDWKGIAFDGSHGTHTGLTGERHFVNPAGPGWASPEGRWDDDARLRRQRRTALRAAAARVGAVSRDSICTAARCSHRRGHRRNARPRIARLAGLRHDAGIHRTLNVAAATKPLVLRVAPDSVSVVLRGRGQLRKEGGFWVASLPGGAKTRLFISRADAASLDALARTVTAAARPRAAHPAADRRGTQEVTTTIRAGKDDGAVHRGHFPLPEQNPWQSWMRPGGFDFTPDGKAAMVAMWNGDVWRVDGLMSPAPHNCAGGASRAGFFSRSA